MIRVSVSLIFFIYAYTLLKLSPSCFTCVDDVHTTSASVAWPLEISPRHGNMFGGHEVHMSGTCFTQPSLVRCRFGDVITEARYDGNLMQVRCVSPMQDKVGTVKVAVSETSGVFSREADYVIGKYFKKT